jgi:hypothetical protein
LPYIETGDRPHFNNLPPVYSVGELNYLLTRAACQYAEGRGLSYQTINDVIGALECAKQEFLRRVVGPYEDKKIEENGDVYPSYLVDR